MNALSIPNCAKGTALVTADRLNVRVAPNTNAVIRGVVVRDEAVTVWAVDGDWAIVQDAAGLTGWAAMAYLHVVGELAP